MKLQGDLRTCQNRMFPVNSSTNLYTLSCSSYLTYEYKSQNRESSTRVEIQLIKPKLGGFIRKQYNNIFYVTAYFHVFIQQFIKQHLVIYSKILNTKRQLIIIQNINRLSKNILLEDLPHEIVDNKNDSIKASPKTTELIFVGQLQFTSTINLLMFLF